MRPNLGRFDALALVGSVAIAALLRFPGLAARGRFDADQGHDMATLVAFTRDGIVPLLGPKTSVGDFHHGAFYYFLLAPAAAISNGDPVVVTAFIALLGIAAVALTWWLARSIAGPLAGALAGLLLAVSPAGVEQSTFIWNPNPIAFFAVLSLSAAWRAHALVAASTDARARPHSAWAWWAISIGAAGAVTQLHVLGVVFLFAILGLAIIELRHDRRVAVGILGGLSLVVLLFVPFLVHELVSNFSETKLILHYLGGGDGPAAARLVVDPIPSLAFTFLRVTGWPIVGLVTDVPALAAIVLAVSVGLAAIGVLGARGIERTGLLWLIGILAWSTVVLAFAAPSLQTVVAGLPNDHYHAFLDPIVIILIAAPIARRIEAALAAWRSTHRPIAAMGAGALAIAFVAILGVALWRNPPAVDPDGGWPALQAAGQRVVADAKGVPIIVFGLPAFKLPDAVSFPIQHAGANAMAVDDPSFVNRIGAPGGTVVVIACDRLFDGVEGQACGGSSEDALITSVTALGSGPEPLPTHLIDRFDASPRTVISVYAP